VPDLPYAFQLYAEQIEKYGVTVDVLIWNPRKVSESSFDDWGRPIAKNWNSRQIDLTKSKSTLTHPSKMKPAVPFSSALKTKLG